MSDLRMSLSLDLDDHWSYLQTQGNERWKSYPSYLDTAVPRILEFLAERDINISFFVVGQDAAIERNHDVLASIPAAGHEVANHSFHHHPWLHLYTEAQLHEELERAELAIRGATGVSVTGFRGPGFSLSKTTLDVLQARGYAYDATTFPSSLNPVARAWFLARSTLSAEERTRRKALFGSFSDALKPITPYRWQLDAGELIEVPVTTLPWLRLPIHFSYLVYLASFSRHMAEYYTRLIIQLCRLSGTEPSLLLHPLDFLGGDDDVDGLDFFPGMRMPRATKLAVMARTFDLLLTHLRPVPLGEFVTAISQAGELDVRHARFQLG